MIRWLGKTERLTRLINQILDLSKLESGTTEWRETSLDLKEVIESEQVLRNLPRRGLVNLSKAYDGN
ncbi:MAG: hypothetical protein IPO58_05835 [Betaproteobacteria bacterium]|nr:hypothetical protein [Betaproteobacteria bacterium]MBK9605960.1 hypothetical protein [Betaproteobacteria bacterium]